MNTSPGTVGSDPVILATAGYDHTVRFWQAHSGICTRTVQHQDSVSLTGGQEEWGWAGHLVGITAWAEASMPPEPSGGGLEVPWPQGSAHHPP